MMPMTIPQIHAEMLLILKHLHEFCQRQGIRYGLTYGTLLGAIRHKGFIPWDDDADVFMPRADYERFVKEYVDTDDYKLYAPEKQNSGLAYGRICEMRRTFFGQRLKWAFDDPGVGVDIFPYDFVADGLEEFQADVRFLEPLRDATFQARHCLELVPKCWKPSWNKTLLRNCKDFIHLGINLFAHVGSERRLRVALDTYCSAAQKYKGGSAYMGDMVLLTYGKKEHLPYEWVCNFVEKEFCDTKLMIPVGYDEVLRNYYGDYMIPPSVENRETHADYQTMYWRNGLEVKT